MYGDNLHLCYFSTTKPCILNPKFAQFIGHFTQYLKCVGTSSLHMCVFRNKDSYMDMDIIIWV